MTEHFEDHHSRHSSRRHSSHSNHGHHEHREHSHSPYSDYGIDYGERARRILEANNHESSAFKPVGQHPIFAKMNVNTHARDSNKLQPEPSGTDRLQRRRHSMFEDSTGGGIKAPIHHVKQMHLDDIVLAYTKKHPNDGTIGHNTAHAHFSKHETRGEHSRTRSVEVNTHAEMLNHSKYDRHKHVTCDDTHRSTRNYIDDMPSKHDTSLDSCNRHLRELHLSERHHEKQYEDRSRFEHSGPVNIGAKVRPRSPTADECHHISMSRANGYKRELDSPELEALRAYRDRGISAKELERHALAQIISEGCRRRNEREGEDHYPRRHSGHDAVHSDHSGTPVPGERRHTLAAITGREIQQRRKHTGKSRDPGVHKLSPDSDEHEYRRHSSHGRKHASHDDVTSESDDHYGDFLMAPKMTGRRHSWTHVGTHAP